MKLLRNSLLSLLLSFWVLACQSPEKKANSTPEAMKSKTVKPVIYQMFTRLFTNTNTTNKVYGTIEENGVGKFNEINETALNALKDLGVTHVWYTGVIEHAVLTDYRDFGITLDDADVVKGRAGSPYAIKDYYDVNPDMAEDVNNRMAEFEALIQRTHAADMKVIVDLVPNHVARSYISDAKPEGITDFGADDDASKAFDPNNNFYYITGEDFKVPGEYNSLGDNTHPTKDGKFDETPAKATGNDVFTAAPSINDWFETVKLNYGVDYLDNRKGYFDPVPDTWQKVLDVVKFWTNKGVDGFRCDMAEMVPVEFWAWMIPQIQEINPDIKFIAEIYNPDNYRNYIQTGGFDYLYDKVELYDTLKHIIQGYASTDDITQIWQRQESIEQNMLRFLENHDEQRIASPDFAGEAVYAIPAMVVSTTMGKGPVMVYFGQEVGEPGAGVAGFSGEDGRTTIFDYWGVPEHVKWVNNGKFDGGQLSEQQKSLRNFYRDILKLANESSAIAEGGFFDLHYYNRSADYTGYSNKIYAFLRHHEGDNLLILTNFNKEQKEEVKVKIPESAIQAMGLANQSVISITTLSGENVQELNNAAVSDISSDVAIKATIPKHGYKIYRMK